MKKEQFMQRAIDLSIEGSSKDKGGPFGAVVVKDGKIVGESYNQVTSTNDPTAHAEVMAIRDACKNLKTFDLSGCELYTSCEPCPMCLGAIYWQNLIKFTTGIPAKMPPKLALTMILFTMKFHYHFQNGR